MVARLRKSMAVLVAALHLNGPFTPLVHTSTCKCTSWAACEGPHTLMFKRKFTVPRPAGAVQKADEGDDGVAKQARTGLSGKENAAHPSSAHSQPSGCGAACASSSAPSKPAAPAARAFKPIAGHLPAAPVSLASALDPLAAERQMRQHSKPSQAPQLPAAADDDSAVFWRVLYVKSEQFFKRKAQKVYVDGVLSVSQSTGQATLLNMVGCMLLAQSFHAGATLWCR